MAHYMNYCIHFSYNFLVFSKEMIAAAALNRNYITCLFFFSKYILYKSMDAQNNCHPKIIITIPLNYCNNTNNNLRVAVIKASTISYNLIFFTWQWYINISKISWKNVSVMRVGFIRKWFFKIFWKIELMSGCSAIHKTNIKNVRMLLFFSQISKDLNIYVSKSEAVNKQQGWYI